jgi:hypothetical protein
MNVISVSAWNKSGSASDVVKFRILDKVRELVQAGQPYELGAGFVIRRIENIHVSHFSHLQAFNQLVTLPVLAQHLGLPMSSHRVIGGVCPYCREDAWYTTHDNGADASWHYCSACSKSGHLLDLLADRQGLPARDVFTYLRSQVKLSITPAMQEAYEAYRKTIQLYASVFREAQRNLLTPTVRQRSALRRAGLLAGATVSPERWFETMGQLVGILTTSQLISLKFPVPSRRPDVFLVVPYCVVPGYVHRLRLISETTTWDVSAASAVIRGESAMTTAFAGLQLLHKRGDNWLVATSMTEIYLRMHVRNFSTDSIPIPLIGWCRDEHSVLVPDRSLLRSRPLVLWERMLSAPALHLAKVTDARIFLGVPGDKDNWVRPCSTQAMRDYSNRRTAAEQIRRIHTEGLTPRNVLARWWAAADDADKVRLYDSCLQFSDVTAELLKYTRCKTDARRARWQEVRIHGRVFYLRNNQVYDASGNVVVPYSFEIRQVVSQRNNVYSVAGLLKTPTQQYRLHFYAVFTNQWRVLHTDVLRRACVRAGLETGHTLPMSNDNMFRLLFELSLKQHSPDYSVARLRTGWSGLSFTLPGSQLGRRVKPRPYQLVYSAPGPRHLPRTNRWADIVIGVPQATLSVFCSTLVVLGAQLIGLRYKLRHAGICIEASSRYMTDLIKALRIKCVPKTGFWKHDWPYLYVENGHPAVAGNVDSFVTQVDDEFTRASSFVLLRVGADIVFPPELLRMLPRLVAVLIMSVLRENGSPIETWQGCLEKACEIYGKRFPWFSMEIHGEDVQK